MGGSEFVHHTQIPDSFESVMTTANLKFSAEVFKVRTMTLVEILSRFANLFEFLGKVPGDDSKKVEWRAKV